MKRLLPGVEHSTAHFALLSGILLICAQKQQLNLMTGWRSEAKQMTVADQDVRTRCCGVQRFCRAATSGVFRIRQAWDLDISFSALYPCTASSSDMGSSHEAAVSDGCLGRKSFSLAPCCASLHMNMVQSGGDDSEGARSGHRLADVPALTGG